MTNDVPFDENDYEPGTDPTPVPIEHEWHKHDWTAQEVNFASEYLRTGSARRAHMKAFPELYWTNGTRKSFDDVHNIKAEFTSQRILREPWMQGYITFVRAEIVERMRLTKENVLEEVAKLAFSNMTDFVVLQEDGTPQFDLSGLSAEQYAAIGEMTIDTYMDKADPDRPREVKSVKIKLAPKIGALELLGKNQKLWTDVVEDTTGVDVAEVIRQRRAKLNKRKQAKEIEHDKNERPSDD